MEQPIELRQEALGPITQWIERAYALGRYQSGQMGRAVNPLRERFGGSNPSLPICVLCGNSSVGRASAFQAVCRGFESRFPLSAQSRAHVAQLVEHVLGKDGVTSSNLVVGLADTKESLT